MKTYTAKPAEIEKKWILIDAEGNEVARMTGDADWSSPAALALVDQMLSE